MFNELIGNWLAGASDKQLDNLINNYLSVEFVRNNPKQIMMLLNEYKNRFEAAKEDIASL